MPSGITKRGAVHRGPNILRVTTIARGLARQKGHSLNRSNSDFNRALIDYMPWHKIVAKEMKKLEGMTIVHLGASTGIYTRFLQDKGANATALDVTHDAAEISKAIGNRRPVRANARQLPFREGSLDAIISDHFLFSGYLDLEENILASSHVSIDILGGLSKLLRPGGKIFMNRAHFFTLENQKAVFNGFSCKRKSYTAGDGRNQILLVLTKK